MAQRRHPWHARVKTVTDWLQPRDHAVAARTVSTLCMVAAGVTIIFALSAPGGSDGVVVIAVTVVVAALAMFGGWMMRYLPADHEVGWAAVPFLGIAAIVALDVLTSDASVPAQVFFFFPLLYGASQMKRHGAATVSAVTVAVPPGASAAPLTPHDALLLKPTPANSDARRR